jgi:probable HAF family extracellular repeat protein
MSMDGVRSLSLGIAGALACVGWMSTAQAQSLPQFYQVIDAGDGTLAGINNKNQAVGTSLQGQAFMYDPATGTRISLGILPGGTGCNALDINENSEIVGNCDGGSGNAGHGFIYRGGVLTEIPMPVGTPSSVTSFAQGITDEGDAIGAYNFNGHTTFIYTHGFSLNIPPPPDVETHAYAINNSWQMAGVRYDSTIGVGHATRFNLGEWEDLGTLGSDAFGYAINEGGEVAGESNTDFGTRAFVYRNGAMTDLGTLPGFTEAGARGINSVGQIVGYSASLTPPTFPQRAFVYSGAQMFNLTAMIHPADPLKPYVTLESASAINDSGWIAASGTDSRTGESHAYLLRPL